MPMPSGDELTPTEAQVDLRVTLNERREQEIEITPENIDSIILESSQTVAKEQDLRHRLNKTKTTGNTPTAEEGETDQQEEPWTEQGELAPSSDETSNVVRHELSPKPWPRPWPRAVDP